MTLVTRYPLVSRVEREVNNDLRLSLLGSDNMNGLYNGSPSNYRHPHDPLKIVCAALGRYPLLKKETRGQQRGFLRSRIRWSP